MGVRIVCDFCASPEATHVYHAKDFTAYEVAGYVGKSTGPWAACSDCARLIEADDRQQLANRSVVTLMRSMGFPKSMRPQLLAQTRQIHARFFQNRIQPIERN